MNGWFTVEKIDGQTFAISEYGHWEQTHCYLLLGENRAALIDTGLGVSNIAEIVKSLTELPVLAVATHAHWDHIGGRGLFEDIAVHEAEESWLFGGFPLPLPVVRANLMKEPCVFPQGFDGSDYRVFQGRPSRLLKDGDEIALGGRAISVIHTPGHSPGHICLFEQERGYLFTGDLVYKDCLYAFYPSANPADSMDSVEKILRLGAKRLFPGHHSLKVFPELISRVYDGFKSIEKRGRLSQGQGMFEFDGFGIRI